MCFTEAYFCEGVVGVMCVGCVGVWGFNVGAIGLSSVCVIVAV